MTERLPAGWTRAALGEVAETRLGKMLSAKAKAGTSPRPYLRNKNVQWGRIDISDIAEMDFDGDEVERFEVAPGDLLICEGGEVGRAAIWRGQLAWVGYQKALHRVRPARGVSSEYLAFLMRWFASTDAFEPYVTGSTIKHLPQEDLRVLPVPVPPEHEQLRIVAAIEEQFSRIQAGDQLVSGGARRLRAYRSSVLRGLTDGAWPQRRLGEISEVLGGKTPKGLEPSPGGTIPFYKVGDMNMADGRHMAGARTYLSRQAVTSYGLRLFPTGTVIFPKQGGAIATNKKRVLTQAAACDLNTMGVIPSSAVLPDYVWLILEAVDLGKLSDGSVVPQIKRGSITDLVVPLPPIDQQEAIVAEAERQISICVSIQAEIDQVQRRSAALGRSILERAFRGSLVAQEPADEPASALLERIASARAGAPNIARRRMKARA